MLTLLGWIYGKIADLRNALYDRGIFETFDLGARTISIGNITTGGTGKTPLVAYVATVLADRGERVCVLTRGYGRENERRRVLVSDGEKVLADFREAGDEPVELANKLLGKAIIIADADRVSSAEWAKRKFGVTVFVLDDGFQHRRVKRDVDILCIDATDPFGGGRMLPAGRLREPLHALARTDVTVITRTDLVDDISNLRFEISQLSPAARVFESSNELRRSEQNAHSDEKAVAFCAIGNPKNFFDQLRRDRFSIVATQAFADHHVYSQNDFDDLARLARRNNARIMLTTAKDAVKLAGLKFEFPYSVVEIEVEVDDAEGFATLL
jgi:tetraacyldisaccharide 4'-kinase